MSSTRTVRTDLGDHFSCSVSAVALARVDAFGGAEAVNEALRLAGSRRSREYLSDITNWIAYDEAVALWRAGARVTRHPQFARAVGIDAAERMGGSQVAAMLRSLGSPENVYRAVATGAAEFSTVTKLEVTEARPGFAEVVAVAVDGYPRSPEHCVYRVRWQAAGEERPSDRAGEIIALRHQLDAMRHRLHSVFATASDLIAADEVDDVLARITDRAALEVRAIRYLLAVRIKPDGELHRHHKGFVEDEIPEYVEALLDQDLGRHPPPWLVVPVRSNRREYGRLLALRRDGATFFPQERELFEVYARYAASALDGAAALIEAKERGDQASALLSLARAMAAAGTSGEVARRLANAVPVVVDCDRVGVCLWDAVRGQLVRRAVTTEGGEADAEPATWVPDPGSALERLVTAPGPVHTFGGHGRPSLASATSSWSPTSWPNSSLTGFWAEMSSPY